MNITLKKAEVNDWEKVKEIETIVAHRLFHSFSKEEEFKRYLTKSQVFFIMVNNNIAGTISYEPKNGFAEFDSFTLLPEYRSKGIGAEALKQILKIIGIKRVELFTHPENTPAIINYLKAGFVIKSWHDNHFGDGEPRILLVREK